MQTYMHFFIGLVLLALELAAYWEMRRQRSVLREWADANGFKLLKCRRSLSQSLAIMINTSGKQSLTHVTVYDPLTHRNRSGWARLGNYWRGALDKDAIEVEWDRSQDCSPSLKKNR